MNDREHAASMPISAVHAMMDTLELQNDAKRLNVIVNHPEVYPWVRGFHKSALDLTEALAQGNKICLLGKHGGLLFHLLQPGLYEVHTQILPEGRGAWALDCVRACLLWMFSRTDAVEIITRCPHGNLAAKAMARSVGLKHQFTNPQGWVMDDKAVPSDIYSLTIQDWMRTSSGLVERGQWFHHCLDAQLEKVGRTDLKHPDDVDHDRYVGAACEMVFGGQPLKAEAFYARFAMMAGYLPMRVASLAPMRIDIGTALLEVRNDDFALVS